MTTCVACGNEWEQVAGPETSARRCPVCGTFAPLKRGDGEELSLFDAYPIDPEAPVGHVLPPSGMTIEETFWRFHDANPAVYDELVGFAREATRLGAKKLGINQLIERVRWERFIRTGGEVFKINNNHAPYYSRLIMTNEPDLEGIFQTRKLHAKDPDFGEAAE